MKRAFGRLSPPLRHLTQPRTMATTARTTTPLNLQIGCLQLKPEIGEVDKNMGVANELIDRYYATAKKDNKTPKIDILMLPEMSFTGYNFESPENLKPFREETESSKSIEWARECAKKIDGHVLVGYPEFSPQDDATYNSVSMVSPKGDILFTYRKSFLYTADEAMGMSESPDGFQTYGPFPSLSQDIPLKFQVGICMDINPYKFESAPSEYEFGNSVKKNKVPLVLLPMAWTHSKSPSLVPVKSSDKIPMTEEQEKTHSELRNAIVHKCTMLHGKSTFDGLITEPKEIPKYKNEDLATFHDYTADVDNKLPLVDTLQYWIERLQPVWNQNTDVDFPVTMVTANRVGFEQGDVLYAGSSMCAVMDPLQQKIFLRGALSAADEGLMVFNVDLSVPN